MRCNKYVGNSRGVVLIIVLVLFMALSGLTLMTIEVSSRGAVEASRMRSEYEAHFMVEEALSLIYKRLRDDKTPFSDTPREFWAGDLDVDGLEIYVRPCNSKINLNELSRLGGRNTVFNILSRVLPAGADTKILLGSLANWLGHGTSPALKKMDTFYYASKFPSYATRGGRLDSLNEVLLIRGWEDFSPEWLNDNFTVWGGDKININFATRDTLLAFFPKLGKKVDNIIHWRNTRGFTDISQLLSVTGLESNSELYKNMQNCFSVKSNVFEAIVVANVGGCRVVKRYIISRPSTFEILDPSLIYQSDISVTFDEQ